MTINSKGPAPTINELSILQQGENLLISAKLLHQKLKVKSLFANWIQRRIEKFGLEENLYFFPNLEKSKGGRQGVDYFLTLDTAKELSMLEETEIGRNIRRYFIQKEKEARGQINLPKEPEIFKGIKPKVVNGRKLYPYRQFLVQVGYSPKSGGYHYRRSYANHFVQLGKDWMVSQDLALMIFHSRRLTSARKVNKLAQLVLPFYPEQAALDMPKA